jgi:hypothetical protein
VAGSVIPGARPALLLFLLFQACFVATTVWAYWPFIDARYDDAWWSLMEIAGTPLGTEDALHRSAAIALVGVSTLLLMSTVVLSTSGTRGARWVVASIAGMFWMASPWHVAALQTIALAAYLWLVFPAAVALLAWRWARSRRFELIFGSSIAVVLLQWLFAEWAPALNPAAVFLPTPAMLAPWNESFDRGAGPMLSACFWLSLLGARVLLLVGERARESRIPGILALSLIPTANVLMLSEQIQVRADPKLALVYANAYAPENFARLWLMSEFLRLQGGSDSAMEFQRRALAQTAPVLPSGYQLARDCLRGLTPAGGGDRSTEDQLVLDYLSHYDRCPVTRQ